MDKLELRERIPITNQEKEIFRTLRTNIEFTGIENKIIAITSCMPNDGKSFVSYQLACSFAENGKKTLFIDADLRKSVFNQRVNIHRSLKGLCHFLAGQIPFSDGIYETNEDFLYIMPIGAYPTTPTELLSKDRFAQMLSKLKQVFDYVIIDTPPLGNVVDAAIIAKQCDASILVVASDTYSRKFVQKIHANLKTANPNCLGIVLNKVNVQNSYYCKYYGS